MVTKNVLVSFAPLMQNGHTTHHNKPAKKLQQSQALHCLAIYSV